MRWLSLPGWPGHLCMFLAGSLVTASLAPIDFWPLAIVALAALFIGLENIPPRSAFYRGWWFGMGQFSTGVSWVYVSIHDFGAAPPLLAGALTLVFVAGLSLFISLFAWAWVKFFRINHRPWLNAVAFAFLWLASDAFRGWFLTGFPWLYVGYSQIDGPLQGWAPIGGVWLLTLLVALSASLIVTLLRQPLSSSARSIGFLALITPWIISLWLNGMAWTAPKGLPLSVAAVQGNVEQNMKWDPEHLETQMKLYRDLTLSNPRADIVVWPETAVPVLRHQAPGFLSVMNDLAVERASVLITGIPVYQPNENGENRYYNAITVLGEGDGTYLKQKLVPFGEYVPLQDMLRGLIEFFDLPMSDFAAGPSDQPPLNAGGLNIAPFICYEVVYPDFSAQLAASSDLLLTISNDAWFGHSLGPLQHLQMARMRALEAGRWMIRDTNSGRTAIIDPHGQITQQIAPFKVGVLHGSVQPMRGLTPFLQWQSKPLWILGGLILLSTLAFRLYDRRAR